MHNLRSKRRNPNYSQSKDYFSKIKELRTSSLAIEAFVEKYFKSINSKNHLNESWEKDTFDYPYAIVDLTVGTYMLGYDPEKNKFFAMIEHYSPETRYEPSDSEFVDIGEFDTLSEACSYCAERNAKEEFARMGETLWMVFEEFIEKETDN
jgi:hypothetical protein